MCVALLKSSLVHRMVPREQRLRNKSFILWTLHKPDSPRPPSGGVCWPSCPEWVLFLPKHIHTYSVYSSPFNAIRHYSAAKMAHTERDTFTFFPHSTSCDEGITGHLVTVPFRANIHGIRPGHIQGEPPFNHIQPYSCSVHTRTFLLVAFLYILTHSSLNASG